MAEAIPLVSLQEVMCNLSNEDPCPLPSPFVLISNLIWDEMAAQCGVTLVSQSTPQALAAFMSEVSRLHILMGWIIGRHQGEMIRTMQRLWPEMEFPPDEHIDAIL